MSLILHGLAPLHWALAGVGIAGVTLALLFLANRRLGISTGFDDICSLALPAPYFKRAAVTSGRAWRLPLLAGLVLGGFLSAVLGGGWEPTWALGLSLAPGRWARGIRPCSAHSRCRRWTLGQARAEERSRSSGAEDARQILLRVSQDLDDRLTIRRRQPRVFRRRVGSGQDLPQTRVHGISRGVGQRTERIRVDHVAARIPEQPALQVEIAQRSPLAVARSQRAEASRRIPTCPRTPSSGASSTNSM